MYTELSIETSERKAVQPLIFTHRHCASCFGQVANDQLNRELLH